MYNYKPGDYFGELALLRNAPRAASVIASVIRLFIKNLDPHCSLHKWPSLAAPRCLLEGAGGHGVGGWGRPLLAAPPGRLMAHAQAVMWQGQHIPGSRQAAAHFPTCPHTHHPGHTLSRGLHRGGVSFRCEPERPSPDARVQLQQPSRHQWPAPASAWAT